MQTLTIPFCNAPNESTRISSERLPRKRRTTVDRPHISAWVMVQSGFSQTAAPRSSSTRRQTTTKQIRQEIPVPAMHAAPLRSNDTRPSRRRCLMEKEPAAVRNNACAFGNGTHSHKRARACAAEWFTGITSFASKRKLYAPGRTKCRMESSNSFRWRWRIEIRSGVYNLLTFCRVL